jgi:hypothetical protein
MTVEMDFSGRQAIDLYDNTQLRRIFSIASHHASPFTSQKGAPLDWRNNQ